MTAPPARAGRNRLTRRALLGRGRDLGLTAGVGLAAGAGLAPLAGCAVIAGADPGGPVRWHAGRLAIGTGNTTGVEYQVGAGLADVITRGLSGYEAVAAPTNGSADNLRRLARDDVQVGFALADVATDAVTGSREFAGDRLGPRALARVYRSYLHLLVRTDRGIRSVAGLRGRRVSFGPSGSGAQLMIGRLLTAADLDAGRDVVALAWSLQQSTEAIAAGRLDAMFWLGGLPTLGISDLLGSARGAVALLPLDPLLPVMNRRYGDVYQLQVIKKYVYRTDRDLPTLGVPNLLLVQPDLPERLGHDLTRLIFDSGRELTAAHPEWATVTRELAPQTGPVVLHPGAYRYYIDG